MKTNIMCLVAACLMTVVENECVADVISVPAAGNVTVSEPLSVSAVEVHGTLKVTGARNVPAVITADPTTVNMMVGTSAGDDALVDIGDFGAINQGIITIGGNGGAGRIRVGGKRPWDYQQENYDGTHAHRKGGRIIIDRAAGVTPGSSTIDFLTLNEGASFGFHSGTTGGGRFINQSSAYDARILFNGGKLCLYNIGCTYLFRTASSTYMADDIQPGDGGKAFVLKGMSGHAIRILSVNGGSYYPCFGVAKMTGDCDVELEGDVTSVAQAEDWAVRWNLDGGVKWEQAGDLILKGYAGLKCLGENVLPCSASTGAVVLEGDASQCSVDLYGCRQKLNGLIVRGENASLKNSSASRTTLTFGIGKTDGILSVPRFTGVGAVGVVKDGVGTLTISNTPAIADLTVSSGTVRFRGGAGDVTAISVLTLAAGTSVVIDGIKVETPSLIDAGANVQTVNGGELVRIKEVGTGAKEVVDGDKEPLGAYESIKKTGAGTLTYASSKALAVPSVHVAEGTMRFAEIGTANKFWKIAITATAGGGENKLNLSAFRLYDRSRNFCDGGSEKDCAAIYTRVTFDESAVSQLKEREIMFSCTDYQTEGSHGSDQAKSPEMAMFSNTSVISCAFDLAPSEERPLVIYYRIPADTADAYGYDVKAQWDGPQTKFPGAWSIWSSPTGEAGTWILMDAQSGQRSSGGQTWYGGNDEASSASGAYRRSLNPYACQVADSLGAGFASTACVRVDDAAVLDCSKVRNGQEVSRIEVDCLNGGGTLRGVAFAESGEIDLVGVSVKVASGYVIPLGLDAVSGTGNLGLWKVLANGCETTRRLVFADGHLEVVGPGAVVIIR